MAGFKIVKAMITSTEGAAPINFQFNPTELDFKRSVSLTRAKGARTKTGLPKASFAYPQPVNLSISNIIFDTYETRTSVLTVIDPILKATDFLPALGRPPIYIFAWGGQKYIKCFITQVSYKLTMFLEDGTPVRAVISMSLEEVGEI